MRETDEVLRIARQKQNAAWTTQAVKLKTQLAGLLVEKREVRTPIHEPSAEQLRQPEALIQAALDGRIKAQALVERRSFVQ